jgi:hypothetical protein
LKIITKYNHHIPKPRGESQYHVDAFHFAAHLLIGVGIEKSSDRGHKPVFEKIKIRYNRKMHNSEEE